MNENKNYLPINIFIVVLMVFMQYFLWYNNDTIANCNNKELHFLIARIWLFISIGWIGVIHFFRLFVNWQPLIIPMFFLSTLLLPEILHGNNAVYFIFTICCSALSALYLSARPLLVYIIISQIIIFVMYFAGYFQENSYTITARWLTSAITSFVLYILIINIKNREKDVSDNIKIFVSMLKISNDHIIILDNQRRVKYISNSLIKKLGFEKFPDIFENCPFLDLFKQSEFKRFWGEVLAKDNYQAKNVELIDILGNGENRFMNIKFQKLPDNIGFLLQTADVTDIARAKNEAENANKSKSKFLADMSHEIRTPLNAIIGLVELELRKNLPFETQINLEKVYNSGEVLLNTINDILDISKIEAGRLELNPHEYLFSSFMFDTLNMNILRIGSKPLKMEIEIDENIPEKLIGDEMRIRQIFNNLISNAIKYTFEGTISVKVGGVIKDNSIWISLSVKDTGIGITKENITKLFQNYSMVDVKNHRQVEGTGLGLSITKQLVNLMDGDISVESTYGKGSTFTVKFKQEIKSFVPIGKENATNIQNFASSDRPFNRPQILDFVQIPNACVLVVDDVQVNLDVAVGMLSAYGMRVDTANSGREAIAIIREQKTIYDIIFMDHMMPELDGIETVKKIRNEIESDYAKNIIIVALTANALVGMSKVFLENGFQDYLSKPIKMQRLDDIIHKWLVKKEIGYNTKQIAVVSLNENDIYLKLLAENPIAGINFNDAIKQFNSMPKIYFRVLESFVKNMPQVIEKLQNPTKDTINDYKISVHGLKGSCYGIGANEAGKIAEILEKYAAAQNLSAVLEKNNALLQLVRETIDSISALLNKVKEITPTQTEKNTPDKELLHNILSAATSFDIDKINKELTELEKFTYENGNDLIKELRKLTDNFDYEKITETLNHSLDF